MVDLISVYLVIFEIQDAQGHMCKVIDEFELHRMRLHQDEGGERTRFIRTLSSLFQESVLRQMM